MRGAGLPWLLAFALVAAPVAAQDAGERPSVVEPASPDIAADTDDTAAPEPAGPDGASASIVVKGKGEKKICRNETTTGSIMPRRICRTRSEMEAEAAAAAQALDTMRRDRDRARHTADVRGASGS